MRVSGIRRVNLIVEIFLWNYFVRTEDAIRRVEYDIRMAGERVDLAEMEEARVDGLWAIMYLIMESEQLQARLECARQQVEAFDQTIADPATTEAEEKVSEDLTTKIRSLILFYRL